MANLEVFCYVGRFIKHKPLFSEECTLYNEILTRKVDLRSYFMSEKKYGNQNFKTIFQCRTLNFFYSTIRESKRFKLEYFYKISFRFFGCFSILDIFKIAKNRFSHEKKCKKSFCAIFTTGKTQISPINYFFHFS